MINGQDLLESSRSNDFWVASLETNDDLATLWMKQLKTYGSDCFSRNGSDLADLNGNALVCGDKN